MKLKYLSRSAVLAIFAMPFAHAGGLFFSIGNPDAVSDPAARGAFVTARVLTCFGDVLTGRPIRATAEGLVNGKRVSVPRKVVPLSTPGLHAIQWTRPAEGVWVLELRESYDLGVIVPVGRDGVRPRVEIVLGSPNPYQIKAVLAELAAGT